MKNLQELKTWADAEWKKANEKMNTSEYGQNLNSYYGGRSDAFFQIIQQLDLLLDSENEKSSQSSQGDGSNSSNAM